MPNAKTPPHHAPLTQFPINDNQLIIGGKTVAQLADIAGQTPFYAYDRAAISERVNSLRQQMPAKLHIHYAIKANPMPALVQHMAGLVDGFDLASAGEMKVALDTVMDSAHISFAGPGKTDAELRRAIAAGVTINVESPNELQRLADLSTATGYAAKTAIRVNPDFELKASGMKMGGGPKQFGIDAEQVPALLSEITAMGLEFMGFHIFSGSQNLRAEAITEAHDNTFALAYRLAQQAPAAVSKLNIGGGLGIPYFPGENRLALTSISANLEKHIEQAHQTLGPQANIIMELGRYLVGEAGIYVCRVVDRKISRDHTYLITDGGLHHHLSVSGNFGQVIRKNYPVVVASAVKPAQSATATAVGPLCTPLDLLADRMELGHARIGDCLAVLQSGAYGLSASPTAFLSHPAAVEILV